MKAIDVLSKVLTVLIVAIVILALVAFVYAYVGNGQQNFYVSYGNKTLVGEVKDFAMPKDMCTVFHVGTLMGQIVDYDVSVTPVINKADDFEFTIDGEVYLFSRAFNGYDCTETFIVSKSSESFVVCYPSSITLEDLVQSKYPGQEVADVPDGRALEFVLTVTDSVEKSVTSIYFH